MNNVTITIEYKLSDSSEWHIVEFLPDEYFDLEPNEKVTWDCVPLYNDTLDYLDIDKYLVQYLKTTIVDLEANATTIVTETFWNQGENRIVIVEDTVSEAVSWWETIVDIKLKNFPPTWEILRFNRENNLPKPSYHGLITENDDGSQEEQTIYPD